MKKIVEKRSVVRLKYKKPNPFVYVVLLAASYLAKWLFHFHVDKNDLKAARKIKSPVLILANHQSPLDFLFMTNAMSPKRLSFVVAANMFYDKRYAWALRLIGRCIPKRQFTSDFTSVKHIRNMIMAGVSVVVYPEGRCSIDGTEGYINPAIYKLIKWLHVPVILVKSRGAYLTRPRYAEDFRKGKVEAEVKKILTAEDCSDLSLVEIENRICSQFGANDFLYQRQNNIVYKVKYGHAHGMKNLLYQCPKCGAEFEMTENGDSLECGVCGYAVHFDCTNQMTAKEGDPVFERVDLWFQYQKESVKKEIDKREDYSFSSSVTLLTSDDNEGAYKEIENGTLTVDKEGFYFQGSQTALRFLIVSPQLAIDIMSHIDFFEEHDIYRFAFRGKERPVKFDIINTILYWKYRS